MPTSSTTYTGDGITTNFALPFGYIKEADLAATVNGVSTAFTTQSSGQVLVISPAPVVGSTIVIQRTTDISEPFADFEGGSMITEADLDGNQNQALYKLQELGDDVNEALTLNITRTAYDFGVYQGLVPTAPTINEHIANKLYVDQLASEIQKPLRYLHISANPSVVTFVLPVNLAASTESALVTLNGVILQPTTDYIIAGNILTLASPVNEVSDLEVRVVRYIPIYSDNFTATNSQTAFTLTRTSSEGDDHYIVALNGITLTPTTDYSVSGSTLTLTEGAELGDILDVRVVGD